MLIDEKALEVAVKEVRAEWTYFPTTDDEWKSAFKKAFIAYEAAEALCGADQTLDELKAALLKREIVEDKDKSYITLVDDKGTFHLYGHQRAVQRFINSSKWQPIDTAPKDTRLLFGFEYNQSLFGMLDSRLCGVFCTDDGKVFSIQPTHWMTEPKVALSRIEGGK